MQPHDVKRFHELWRGDPEFRGAIRDGRHEVVKRWGADVDVERIRPLWDESLPAVALAACDDPTLRAFLASDPDGPAGHDSTRHAATTTAYGRWRRRQINRYLTESEPRSARSTCHAAFSVELTRGCSIGCSYCGVSAPPLTGVARIDSHGQLFRDVLRELRALLGDAARTGFLYWATDPFDNLDYERYLDLFEDEIGEVPQTTTAAWPRNLARTRRLIERNRSRLGAIDRLSINSLEQLHLCLREFSAEELASVWLVLQNPEALAPKCAAGRGREVEGAVDASIACVSGFLLQLVERTVALITPTADLQSWPLGYAVLDRASFCDAAQLRDFLETCERDVFTRQWRDSTVPGLRRDLALERAREGRPAVVKARFADITVRDPIEAAVIRAADGRRTVSEIVAGLMAEWDPAPLYWAFSRLWDAGVFERLPTAGSAPPLVPLTPVAGAFQSSTEESLR